MEQTTSPMYLPHMRENEFMRDEMGNRLTRQVVRSSADAGRGVGREEVAGLADGNKTLARILYAGDITTLPRQYAWVAVLRNTDGAYRNHPLSYGGSAGSIPVNPAVEANGNPSVPVDGSAIVWLRPDNIGAQFIFDYAERPRWARVNGSVADVYGFVEVYPTSGGGWSDLTGGVVGTTSLNPAYELNGLSGIADGTIIEIKRAYCTGAPQVVIKRTQAGDGSLLNEVQTLYIVRSAAGTFKLIYQDGVTAVPTADIAYSANAAAIESALEALAAITNVSVTGFGTENNPFVITFLDDTNPRELLTSVHTLLASDQEWQFTSPYGRDFQYIRYVKVVAESLPAFTVSGGGNTITANANGAFPTTDSVAMVLNDDFLYAPGSSANTGVWRISQLGTGGTPWIADRRDDINTTAEMTPGNMVYVQRGTIHGDSIWTLDTDTVTTLGTTPLTYTRKAPERVQMSVTKDSSGLKLSGDTTTPGNSKYYGTNGAGTRGWYTTLAYISSLNGLTAAAQLFSNANTGVAPSWTSISDTHTLNIPDARQRLPIGGPFYDAPRGLMTGSTQHFSGEKWFHDLLYVANEAGDPQSGAIAFGGYPGIGVQPAAAFIHYSTNGGGLEDIVEVMRWHYTDYDTGGTAELLLCGAIGKGTLDYPDGVPGVVLYTFTDDAAYAVASSSGTKIGVWGSLFGAGISAGIVTSLPSTLGTGSIPISDGSGGLYDGPFYNPLDGIGVGVTDDTDIDAALDVRVIDDSLPVIKATGSATLSAPIIKVEVTGGTETGGYSAKGYQYSLMTAAPASGDIRNSEIQGPYGLAI